MKKKYAIDLLLFILFVILMLFHITEGIMHEIAGVSVFILIVYHNLLNRIWWKRIFNGQYNLLKCVQTILNIFMITSVVLTIFTGVYMSRHLFAFFDVRAGMRLARKTHMIASYWTYLLTAIHLGFHWDQISRFLQRKLNLKVLNFIIAGITVYGFFTFVNSKTYVYLLGLTEFSFHDSTKASIVHLIEYFSLFICFATMGNYLKKSLIRKRKRE